MDKTEKLTLRLSPEDMTRLRARCRKTGLSQSAYLRMLIQGVTPKVIPAGPFLDVLSELREISGSMAQIAAVTQMRGEASAEEYQATSQRLFSMLLSLEKAVMEPEQIEDT